MRCVSVTMLPGYFRSFLPKCFSVDHQELVHSVEGLSGMVTMPELEYLFAQICRINISKAQPFILRARYWNYFR